MATTQVVLDGFAFSGTSPRNGRYKVLEMSGWVTRQVRRNRDAKAQQDGDWPTSGSVTGRGVVISGIATYQNPQDAGLERRQLAAIGGNGTARLTVTDSHGTHHADVETDGVTVDPITDLIFSWSLAVYATDPLVYGDETFGATILSNAGGGTGLLYPLAYPLDYGVPPGVTPGAITIPNVGTGTYWPRLRIDGPVPNPTLTLVETGDTIRYNGALTAGQWLDIDCGNRRVLLNGQASQRFKVTSVGRWLAIPPGGGSIAWTADAADPAATLTAWGYQSAWL